MEIIYKATFQIDLGDAITEVGSLMNRINSHLSTAGYDERITCKSNIFSIYVTVDRELTTEEQRKMKVLLEAEYIKAFPEYSLSLASFGRKSGNVEQSVV